MVRKTFDTNHTKCGKAKVSVDESRGPRYLWFVRRPGGREKQVTALADSSHGRVAQLVEQRTENPRVGGSNPSPATFFALSLFAWLGTGCGQDSCDELCAEMSWRMSLCVDEWPEGWSEVGARGRNNFRRACQNQWADQRAQLESWELDDAFDQCDETSVALRRADNRGTTCDELRALYIEP